jgi:hypothetical protein
MADPLFQALVARATQAEAKDHARFAQATVEAGAMAAVYAERVREMQAAAAAGAGPDEGDARAGARPSSVAMRGLLRYGRLEQADIDTYCDIEDADAQIRREADGRPIGTHTYRPVSSLSRAEFTAAAKRLTDVRRHRPVDPLSHGDRVQRVEGFAKVVTAYQESIGYWEQPAVSTASPAADVVAEVEARAPTASAALAVVTAAHEQQEQQEQQAPALATPAARQGAGV